MSASCRSLGKDIVVSRAFAEVAPSLQARLVPLGSHALRGVTQAQALFALELRAGAPSFISPAVVGPTPGRRNRSGSFDP
jgi:class 3 adenylate cyclase